MIIYSFSPPKFTLWNLKAKLYRIFRHRFPFRYILQQENKSLASLLSNITQHIDIVIDLGTGEGNALKFISNHATKVGVDSSFSMLLNARKNVDAKFVRGDIRQLSFKNEIASLVLIIGVLEYCPESDSIFREIYRITNANKHVIVSFAPKNLWTFLRRFLGHRVYSSNYGKFTEIIKRNGFAIVERHKLMMQDQILIKKCNHPKK